jgi:hypothetical protein
VQPGGGDRVNSYYSVIRYVPDPVADERVNVGLAVFGDGRTRVRFVKNWQRLQSFGGEDTAFLKSFAESAVKSSSENIPLPGFEEPIDFSEGSMRHLAGRWINSIQFSEVRASVLAPDKLIEDLAPRLLQVPQRRKHAFRGRRAAAALATKEIAGALRERLGDKWEPHFERNYSVSGRLQAHQFDAAVKNGQPLLAARGLSFEGPVTRDLERDVRVTAWALDDIRDAGAKIRLAVIALPPKTSSRLFDEAVHVFKGLNAEVVPEDETHDWTRSALSETGVG